MNQLEDVIERIKSKTHSRLPEFEITIRATDIINRSKSGKLQILETKFRKSH